ncbi:MAG: hypothetical protein A2X13_09245 [Bacteroidetes bacterium GWC2_33_15]|nr:MAG: hypothetical protein A2X10_01875 [Bacteroidetes bacterium GWA2_33_15]OFX49131.1 MAG: hypothetical protein A2X13_09245 [Bacteroidetes bacterium GWC2_33_15]OFX64899.1 MAG: hypothetical protein A2X15_06120 [Bacteroidetes bacterium GWB2_32_14]OFX68607.1 MAG: hypothetical protein A2X14_14685 [Bacteroidetes bacterium GWD2_33_33]HAN17458.1 hypothetical protein [Bacteroidales bacterium]
MIPREKILNYLDKYGTISKKMDIEIVFDIINSSVFVFSLVLNDLESNNFIITSGHIIDSNELMEHYLPSSLYNLKIELTEKGKHYVESKFINSKSKRFVFNNDSTDNFKIGNTSGKVSTFMDKDFEMFENNFKKTEYKYTPVSPQIAYYLLTSKYKKIEPSNVFISYSWDNEVHKKWILKLYNKLSKHFKVILDQKDFKAGMHQFETMKNSILQSDKVLVVFTPNYKERSELTDSGVNYEFSVLGQDLYKRLTNDKFIPILRSGTRESSVPGIMKHHFDFDMRDDGLFDGKLSELISLIKDEKH